MGALINIILDPIFIFGYFGLPAFGVKVSCHRNCDWSNDCDDVGNYNYTEKIKEVKIHPKEWKLDIKMIGKMYQIGFPAILMQSIMSFYDSFYEYDFNTIFRACCFCIQYLF